MPLDAGFDFLFQYGWQRLEMNFDKTSRELLGKPAVFTPSYLAVKKRHVDVPTETVIVVSWGAGGPTPYTIVPT